MAVGPDRPILFLTFANDRADASEHLRNLAEESRQLRRTLKAAPYAHTYTVEHEDHAGIDDILDCFQQHRNRVALFHFGGHADSYRLLTEQTGGGLTLTDGAALASFLASHDGLRLVFLNACATEAQVEGLIDAGVDAVIATRQRVGDAVAMTFADRFYQGLATGATLQQAFDEAAAAVSANSETLARAYKLLGEETPADTPLWLLRVRTESRTAWRLVDLTLPTAWPTLDDLPTDLVPDVGPLPPAHRLELAHNPLFVGRADELRTLAAALKQGNSVAIAAATGAGGIGKTQLAVEFAHRYGRFFPGGVFWLSLANPEGVPAEVVQCGLHMPELPGNFAKLDQEDQLRLVRQTWQSPTPRLLIFDNCEEPALFHQWRLTTGGCRILLTSRHATWERTLGVTLLPLETLPRAESIHLLQKFLAPNEEPTPDEPIHNSQFSVHNSQLDALASELGDLPLALHLAGSYLDRYRHTVTPEAYLAQLRSPQILQHRSLQLGGHSPTGHEQNVARTFALSYDRLDAGDPTDALALRLLARAAHFAPNLPIPRSLLLGSADRAEDDTDAADALARLTGLGLLEIEADGAVRLHRLIALFVQGVTTDAEAQSDVEAAIYSAANRLNQAGYPAALLPWQPHLRYVTEQAIVRGDEQAARLCNELGYHLKAAGDPAGAKPYLEQALAIRRQVLGEGHPDLAGSLNNLGVLLHTQGDLVAATPCLEQALAIRRQVLGEQHPDTASSFNNFGALVEAQGDLTSAKFYYEQALDIYDSVLGKQHPTTATCLNNLGALLQKQGDLTAARLYYEGALAIRKRVLGQDHPVTAQILNNLGALLQEQGDLAVARPYYEQALAIRSQALGDHHPDTASTLYNLGTLLQVLGDPAAARQCYEEALAIYEQNLGPDHSNTQNVRHNLARLLTELQEQ